MLDIQRTRKRPRYFWASPALSTATVSMDPSPASKRDPVICVALWLSFHLVVCCVCALSDNLTNLTYRCCIIFSTPEVLRVEDECAMATQGGYLVSSLDRVAGRRLVPLCLALASCSCASRHTTPTTSHRSAHPCATSHRPFGPASPVSN
jgi:hypothetical protein